MLVDIYEALKQPWGIFLGCGPSDTDLTFPLQRAWLRGARYAAAASRSSQIEIRLALRAAKGAAGRRDGLKPLHRRPTANTPCQSVTTHRIVQGHSSWRRIAQG